MASPKPKKIVEIGTLKTLWDTTIAIACGALVAVFGRMGVAASSADIVVTLGVVLGTFIGVGVLKGSPVGPLIGSGMAVAAISLARMLFHF